jgi:hypothetical protein
MIVDGRDTYVLPEISDSLFEYFPQGSSQRWAVRTAKHNMAREVDAEQFDRRIVEFFSQMVDSPRLSAHGSKPARDQAPRPFEGRASS